MKKHFFAAPLNSIALNSTAAKGNAYASRLRRSKEVEKIIIKPIAKEIVLRGKPEDGHVDVFSYNYEGNGANGLGGLFIVGQVQPATENTSYMINLVASMAKREYYASIDAVPKEAFSKTLKKINEVLQDFFRNKDLKVNIGIFAISGENIFISRLGKFKILLIRGDQDIDILNNINLFSKEHIQDKEFSNVISGRLTPQDKLFAFYPGRSIIAREKNIKNFLAEMDGDGVADKLRLIKQDNENFLCAALHISINKYKEPAIIKVPQPQELQKNEPQFRTPDSPARAILTAKISKTAGKKSLIPPETINVRPLDNQASAVPQIKIEPAPTPAPALKAEIKTDNFNTGNVYYPDNKNLLSQTSPEPALKEESSLIRPTEFSSAKKENFIDIVLKKFKPSGIYIIGVGSGNAFSKKKLITAGSLLVGVIALLIISKLTFAPSLPIPGIESSQDKATASLFENVKGKLESAKTYRDQNNLLEARRLLFEALSALVAPSNTSDSQKTDKLEQEIYSVLDQIDKASEQSPSLFQQIPQDLGESSLIAFLKDKLYVYLNNSSSNGGNIVEVNQESVGGAVSVKDFNPWYLIGGDGLMVMLNKVADKMAALTIKTGDIKTSALALPSPIISLYPYQGNLYILTSDGIYKITDATQGKNNPVAWLNKDTAISADPVLITIDSKIFVMSKNGILTGYYKGAKVSEVNTSIPVDENNFFLTVTGSPDLYLVNKTLGRTYVISKDSGSVIKTLRLGEGAATIISGSISADGTIYLLSKDNKVWKVTP